MVGRPVLTIFAGPNGSGKTSIYKAFSLHKKIPNYINADDIARELKGDPDHKHLAQL